jgi:replicative superfamily II helicase
VRHITSTSSFPAVRLQLVALSATVENVSDLAGWFGGSLFVTHFRPIPLKEFVKVGNEIIDSTGQHVRMLNTSSSALRSRDASKLDPECTYMCQLCAEGLSSGQQVIIFCSSRSQCEGTVHVLANHLQGRSEQQPGAPPLLLSHIGCKLNQDELALEREGGRQKLLEHYTTNSLVKGASQDTLMKGISCGVAFHHAGRLIYKIVYTVYMCVLLCCFFILTTTGYRHV